MAHTSTKKGSNLLCRVANATPQKVCEYVRRLPKTILSEQRFRDIMGSGWFSNEHQAPEQWGLYYIDGKNYYPRFTRDISEKEAEIYLYGWMKRFIVINPYTRFKQTNDNNLVKSIVSYMEIHPDEHNLKTIITSIIGDGEPFVLNEILANALSQYSEVLQVITINKDKEIFQVYLLNNYKRILKTKYMTKKEYFDLFSDIQITSHNDEPRQKIYYGAPGTGKSHEIKEMTKGMSVIRTTFHPDSDYSTFVGCYKPTMVEDETKVIPVVINNGISLDQNKGTYTEKRISYKFVMQAFLKAYLGAWKKYVDNSGETVDPQFLVIEEINRGNCAQIFGDLFQLLDRGDNNFSEYPIEADTDLQKEISQSFKKHQDYKLNNTVNVEGVVEDYVSNYGQTLSQDIQEGRVLLFPPNLYIWATMNTSDQSLFPIDSAFKRRWDWVYVPIDTAKETWYIKIGENYYSWTKFLNKVNDELLTDETAEDKHLGFYFCKATEKMDGTESDPNVITTETFVGKVLFYLWNDVFKVYGIPSSIGSSKDWPYRKFYQIDGKVNEEKVKNLLQNIGVESVAKGEVLDEEEDSDEPLGQRKETLVSIRIPNYPKIESSESTQFNAFIKALQTIGIDRIVSVVDKVKYKRLDCPVLSTSRYQAIDNNNKGYSYQQEGELFVIKGCKQYTYIRILEDLNEYLNIGLSLETK